MKKYHTGYFLPNISKIDTLVEYSDKLIKESDLKLIPSNYKGENWEIEWIFNNEFKGWEFIILTKSFEIAQNILYNILCAAAVVEGTVTWSDEVHYPQELGTIDKINGLNLIEKPIHEFLSLSVPSFFHLTALASKDCKIENSLVKYQLSTEIYSKHYMDLHEVINWKTTKYQFIQMRFAYAIITAYSVIEELGLEIRGANTKNPSILPNKEWNPKIKNNIIKRLTESKININEDIPWMIRGKETDIEKSKPIKISGLTEWADPPDFIDDFSLSIKDGYIHLIDAINYISYLRSSISSHCVGKRIMGLSVFDVANAQFLARRLILEKMNMWKIQNYNKV